MSLDNPLPENLSNLDFTALMGTLTSERASVENVLIIAPHDMADLCEEEHRDIGDFINDMVSGQDFKEKYKITDEMDFEEVVDRLFPCGTDTVSVLLRAKVPMVSNFRFKDGGSISSYAISSGSWSSFFSKGDSIEDCLRQVLPIIHKYRMEDVEKGRKEWKTKQQKS